MTNLPEGGGPAQSGAEPAGRPAAALHSRIYALVHEPCRDFQPPSSCYLNDGTGLWCEPCEARDSLIRALREQWEWNHAEHCRNRPHQPGDRCHWALPRELLPEPGELTDGSRPYEPHESYVVTAKEPAMTDDDKTIPEFPDEPDEAEVPPEEPRLRTATQAAEDEADKEPPLLGRP